MLRKIDEALLRQVVELGITSSIPATMPELALRRSFPEYAKGLPAAHESTILAVHYKRIKPAEVRYVLAGAVWAVFACLFTRITVAYGLAGIESYLKCSSADLLVIDVSQIWTAEIDPRRKPVLVVHRAHLITYALRHSNALRR